MEEDLLIYKVVIPAEAVRVAKVLARQRCHALSALILLLADQALHLVLRLRVGEARHWQGIYNVLCCWLLSRALRLLQRALHYCVELLRRV